MEKEKTIGALNRLVEINNDRIKGYEKVFENTEERDLKDLFSTFKQTSKKCKGELISEINKLGGEATNDTKASGKFFRAWMDVKSALTGKDREAILNSCEFGEENAVEVYKDVLDDESEHLNPEQQEMIKSQLNSIKADQSTVKSMQHSKENTIDALNTLVEINNSRIEGYEKASENTEEQYLKEMFSKFKQTSTKCLDELKNEINQLGGKVTEGIHTSGDFFKAWVDFKSALTGKDRKAILSSCEYGEEHADERYQEVLNDESKRLSPQQLTMIKAQHKLLKADQRAIKYCETIW